MPRRDLRARLAALGREVGWGERADRTATVVLVTSVVLLVVMWHYGRPEWFRGSWLETDLAEGLPAAATEYAGTFPYLYWGAASLVLRIAVPLLVILFVLRARPGDFGFRIRGIGRKLGPYALLFVPMIPLILLAAARSDFQATYPFYRQATLGGLHFWLYEVGYLAQFVALEAFFRGFMVFGLRPRLGAAAAVWVMTIPYVMIHFGKPVPEVFAAIGAGVILGHLALRSRSWVPGVFLHVAVALTMDLVGLTKLTGSLGDTLRAVF